jgi:diguanylate cyclase (GGDEF)-like protein
MKDHLKHTYFIYQHHLHNDGLHSSLLGKFYLDGDRFHMLEDHGNVLPDGISPADIHRKIKRLNSSQRFEIVNGEENPHWLPYRRESASPLVGQIPQDKPESKISEFDYHREGMPSPQRLRLEDNRAYLDELPVQPHELKVLMDNVTQGKAKIRTVSPHTTSLQKMEPALASALSKVQDPEALKVITRNLFVDTIIPTVGNKFAYKDFLSRPREGVHLIIDANDFGQINKTHGHDVGDQAIAALGKTIRASMDESVGRKHGKLFRIGGDEFAAFVPSHQHAALFARSLRGKLEGIPAVRGTHRLSVSVGIGHDRENAELALKDAKAVKMATQYESGKSKTHIASRHPDSTGVIS